MVSSIISTKCIDIVQVTNLLCISTYQSGLGAGNSWVRAVMGSALVIHAPVIVMRYYILRVSLLHLVYYVFMNVSHACYTNGVQWSKIIIFSPVLEQN